jgi:hypothetical protein
MLHHMKLAPGDSLWATVANNLREIEKGFQGIFRIAANVSGVGGASARGYVRFKKLAPDAAVSPYKTTPRPASAEEGALGGSIHIDYSVFKPTSLWTDLGVAALIVHEASHKFCGTDDHAYHHEELKYDNLSKELSAMNADSYALLAASIHAGKVLTERQTDKLSA